MQHFFNHINVKKKKKIGNWEKPLFTFYFWKLCSNNHKVPAFWDWLSFIHVKGSNKASVSAFKSTKGFFSFRRRFKVSARTWEEAFTEAPEWKQDSNLWPPFYQPRRFSSRQWIRTVMTSPKTNDCHRLKCNTTFQCDLMLMLFFPPYLRWFQSRFKLYFLLVKPNISLRVPCSWICCRSWCFVNTLRTSRGRFKIYIMHHALWLIPSLTRCSEGSFNVKPVDCTVSRLDGCATLKAKKKKNMVRTATLRCIATFLCLRLNPTDLKRRRKKYILF